ncbi:hypothetical protein [Streptomyces sp. NBC_01483]|nr:hypothetical protein [Streptomyces sp. NBC_01483]
MKNTTVVHPSHRRSLRKRRAVIVSAAAVTAAGLGAVMSGAVLTK